MFIVRFLFLIVFLIFPLILFNFCFFLSSLFIGFLCFLLVFLHFPHGFFVFSIVLWFSGSSAIAVVALLVVLAVLFSLFCIGFPAQLFPLFLAIG